MPAFEMVHHTRFALPPPEKRTAGAKPSKDPAGGAERGAADGPHVTCHCLHRGKHLLFGGLSTGGIATWRRRLDAPIGHVDNKVTLLEGHSGGVRSLILTTHDGLGADGLLLFSGSADRTIRLWDPAVKDKSKACVQVLRGHGGTVTALTCVEGVLVSCSTDRTIKVWKAEEGRETTDI